MHPEGWARRAVDVAASGLALAVLSPVFAAIALAIVLESGRPVFFSQERCREAADVQTLKFLTKVAAPTAWAEGPARGTCESPASARSSARPSSTSSLRWSQRLAWGDDAHRPARRGASS